MPRPASARPRRARRTSRAPRSRTSSTRRRRCSTSGGSPSGSRCSPRTRPTACRRPTCPTRSPSDTLFLIADDAARLRSRVEQLLGKTTWSENPHSRTRRLLANVRIRRTEGARAWVTANFAVYRMRTNQVGDLRRALRVRARAPQRRAAHPAPPRDPRPRVAARRGQDQLHPLEREHRMDLGIAGRRAIVCGEQQGTRARLRRGARARGRAGLARAPARRGARAGRARDRRARRARRSRRCRGRRDARRAGARSSTPARTRTSW